MVGAGTAGREAAKEATLDGGGVTVLERAEAQAPPWRSWPELISRPGGPAHSVPPSSRGTVSCAEILGEVVRLVGPGFVKTARGLRLRSDVVVVATGCTFEHRIFAGHGKRGVAVLDGAEKYAELGRALGSIASSVVMGEGVRGLAVAERLAGSARKVRLSVSSWSYGEPTPLVWAVLSDSASEKGIAVSKGSVSRAVGQASVEGAVVEGAVVSCDSLVVVPRRRPSTSPFQGRTGPHGGILVDSRMRTGVSGVLASGGCAEVEPGLPRCSSLEGEAAMTGRIAGANSVGGNLHVSAVRSVEHSLFGLRWIKAGVGLGSAKSLGLELEAVSHRWDRYSACTIVYESRNGRIVGIEAIGTGTSFPAALPNFASGSENLRTVSYGGVSSSSDISLVSDTARLGLRSWSKS